MRSGFSRLPRPSCRAKARVNKVKVVAARPTPATAHPKLPAKGGDLRFSSDSHEQKSIHQNLWLPNERVRLGQDERRAARRTRLRIDAGRGTGGPDFVQHLFRA